MSAAKKSDPTIKSDGAPEVSGATDGGVSRLSAGYKDNPEKPDPTSVAQVEELKGE